MKLQTLLSTAAAKTCCFVLLVIFSSVGKSTAQTITNDNLDTNATTTTTGSSRNYTPQQCTSWINSALTADMTNSSSLSQSEYLTFLQSITTPAHVGPYFESFGSFGELPYGARIANVILSCACTTLPGYNDTCCSSTEDGGGAEGVGAEVPLDGFSSPTTNNNSNENNESLLAYRSYFCDILANVVSKVPMPPTLSPSRSAVPTLSGVPSSSTSSPTSTSTATATTPTQVPSKNNVIPPNNNTKEPGTKGTLSPGAITGIILAILVLILVAILILIWYRRKREEEEEQVREFAGENNVYEEVGDDGGGVGVDDEEEEQQQQPEEEDEEEKDNEEEGKDDDASSVPSVWSEKDGSSMKTDAIADANDNDDTEQKMTEGSAVAAMGVASTVVRQLSTPNKNDEYYQLNV